MIFKRDLVLIAAVADDLTIGDKGTLPWNIPEDLRRFKILTQGQVVVMGRKTYDSLPEIYRPLPNRVNLVVTGSPDKIEERGNLFAFSSLEKAIDYAKRFRRQSARIFIAGGAEIYSQALPIVDRLEITHVHSTPGGDTKFPRVNWDDFERVRFEENEGYDFASYLRKA